MHKRVAAGRDGMLIEYEGPAEEYRVNKLLEDRDGVVWATVYVPRSNTYLLCSFQSGGAKCSGQDGGPGSGAIGLYEDTKGRLWLGTDTGLWCWKPAPAQY